MSPPKLVMAACAVIVAIGVLISQLGPMYPSVVYWLVTAQDVLIAVGLYLGWPVPSSAEASSGNPSS